MPQGLVGIPVRSMSGIMAKGQSRIVTVPSTSRDSSRLLQLGPSMQRNVSRHQLSHPSAFSEPPLTPPVRMERTQTARAELKLTVINGQSQYCLIIPSQTIRQILPQQVLTIPLVQPTPAVDMEPPVTAVQSAPTKISGRKRRAATTQESSKSCGPVTRKRAKLGWQ